MSAAVAGRKVICGSAAAAAASPLLRALLRARCAPRRRACAAAAAAGARVRALARCRCRAAAWQLHGWATACIAALLESQVAVRSRRSVSRSQARVSGRSRSTSAIRSLASAPRQQLQRRGCSTAGSAPRRSGGPWVALGEAPALNLIRRKPSTVTAYSSCSEVKHKHACIRKSDTIRNRAGASSSPPAAGCSGRMQTAAA